jgi:hypothetical protein
MGHRRPYRFAEGESRGATDEALEWQLRVTEYLPAEKYDPADRRAR